MKIGFAFEYTLGNITHAENLKNAFAAHPEMTPVYIDVPYVDMPGAWTNFPVIKSNWTIRASIYTALNLRRHGRELDAAFFHTQSISVFSTGLMRRVPSIISLDATPIQFDALGDLYGHRPGNSRLEALKKRLYIRAFNAAKHMVAFSEITKRSLIDDYGLPADKITVIPPGVDTARWDFPERPNRDRVNLLFVGGDFVRKGGAILLDAFKRLPNDALVHLHLVSSSPDAPTGLENATVHRNLTPNSDELLRLFADADIFVFPSLADFTPQVLGEALSSGLPVIATSVGAVPEVVIDGENGLIVPTGDPESLAAAIQTLIEDVELRRKLGQRARQIACDRLDAQRNSARLVSLLQAQVHS